jgi:rhamnopyranosyl-N-acetylglucosaminyl-diphospho-decaprenol beta-1,3/1,4-galactofuranosyltransferase
MMETIAAVVVTYNRKELLVDCLNALKAQSKILDKIFIIDNCSNDGTSDYLFEYGYIERLDSGQIENAKHVVCSTFDNSTLIEIQYIQKDVNDGGSGGFHDGMKIAFAQKFDWIWVMDDDVIPNYDCLGSLLSNSFYSKCLHPIKKYVGGEVMNWESLLDVQTGRVISLNNISLINKDITYVNVANFEGMLIHRSIVGKIGIPDKRYFICGDDLIYGFLASLHTNVCLMKNAIIERKRNIEDDLIISDFTLYYSLRNMHLKNELLDEFYPESHRIRKIYAITIFVKTLFALISNKIHRPSFRKRIESLNVFFHAFSDYVNRKSYIK